MPQQQNVQGGTFDARSTESFIFDLSLSDTSSLEPEQLRENSNSPEAAMNEEAQSRYVENYVENEEDARLMPGFSSPLAFDPS